MNRVCLLFIGLSIWHGAAALSLVANAQVTSIDRMKLVMRHNVVLTNAERFSSLSVGNGEFAFTVDITGLQTFPDDYKDGVQLGTQAQWAWDCARNPEGFEINDVLTAYQGRSRTLVYHDGQGKFRNANNPARASTANAWLRENPYRIQLGRLGLVLLNRDGSRARLDQLQNARQTLDLWTSHLDSRFEFTGEEVRVETVCHPEKDLVAVRVSSPLVKQGRVGVEFGCDERTRLNLSMRDARRCDFKCSLLTSNYFAALTVSSGALIQSQSNGSAVTASNGTQIEVSLTFGPQEPAPTPLPSFESTRQTAARHWAKFWSSGGAVELSGSKDLRWRELERRIVFSQYLTAIQCSGTMPPQETGLVQNSWFGKFHLEMHWWHAAHFALWGRPELLERSLPWYFKIMPAARALARQNGYAGVRWPKMTGPSGEDSPSSVGAFLIWQQPHPIYYAELLYRANPTRATLDRYYPLVQESAEFMASYAEWEPNAKRYFLGPPLIPAQESYGRIRESVINPTYELAYWYWGLQTAQQWRTRTGLSREGRWDEICRRLAKPHVMNECYAAIANEPFTITRDHPSMLQAFGFLPATPLIDPAILGRTYDFVLKDWDWKTTWGWDYPAMAMSATRLARPEDAINALLMDTPKNRYLPNGHVYQRSSLPIYLPANGGLLAATAMMCAGWDGGPTNVAPGFPQNGKWSVRWEGIHPMP